MPTQNTPHSYGAVSKTFHWLTALLILTLIPLGWFANQLPFETDAELTRKAWLFSLHKTMGVLAFFVALMRILWAVCQPKPALLHPERRMESFAAEMVHWLLYGALVIVPLSGWISHAAAAGFAPIWWPFGQGLPLVPKSTGLEHAASAVHWASTKLLILSVLLHIAGALKHHLIDRDATLRRMLPGTAAIPDVPQAPHSALPRTAAVVLWACAFGLAFLLNSGKDHAPAAAPALAEVSSDWQVDQGELTLSVTQFGSVVAGAFADWTAEITFDAGITTGTVGSVRAIISIPSLTLGSVTDQALGADFLDASSFPQAIFVADIVKVSDGYDAIGTLRIKDVTMPVTLPFALSLRGNQAEMRGDLTLNRRDFNIGQNIADEATLGFDVALKITLTATRQGAD